MHEAGERGRLSKIESELIQVALKPAILNLVGSRRHLDNENFISANFSKLSLRFFFSLRYHNFNPDYIHNRLKQLGNRFELRILLVLVDVVSSLNFSAKKLNTKRFIGNFAFELLFTETYLRIFSLTGWLILRT